jgi:hypothetical protein
MFGTEVACALAFTSYETVVDGALAWAGVHACMLAF